VTLEVRNLQPGHVGRVYSSFLQDQNYTSYRSLEFYLGSTLPPAAISEFFLRLCKDANIDSTDYYEYRIPVPEKATLESRASGWKQVQIRLQDLSDLKGIAVVDTSGAAPDSAGARSPTGGAWRCGQSLPDEAAPDHAGVRHAGTRRSRPGASGSMSCV